MSADPDDFEKYSAQHKEDMRKYDDRLRAEGAAQRTREIVARLRALAPFIGGDVADLIEHEFPPAQPATKETKP